MAPPRPRPLVFCGPSGSGKSTLVSRMTKEFPDKFGFSVSHTTRSPRLGEINGQHYHFIVKEEMEQAISEDKFIEYAIFSGNIYGTSKAAVQKIIDQGKICILDIDVQGVKKIKGSNLNAWYIFVEPPSLEELEKRLRARNTETEESLLQRLKVAEEEMIYGKTPGNFHIIITNDNLDHAYDKLKAFLVNFVLNDDFSK
ncbi:guanylate kinase-like [Cylas formicarius]|uniref:guanylate kinase-like n=1 Tax=Cylas formicarius TaxID=197179 RepID=UPI0029583CB4|nr:guanylate kinase-like [Cylas formicarius]